MRIVVDTSAIVAILAGEPERDAFLDLLLRSEPVISAGSMIETLRTVQLRFGPERMADVHELVARAGIGVVSVDAPQVLLAEDAMRRFAKGRGAEPAALNFGDLFGYALARHLPAPLLFKGKDFAATDVTPAMPESASSNLLES